MNTRDIKLYNSLRNTIGEEAAQELVSFIKCEISNEMVNLKDIFLVKQDKVEIMRTIYIVGLVQFFAIVGAIIGIMSFLLSHLR